MSSIKTLELAKKALEEFEDAPEVQEAIAEIERELDRAYDLILTYDW